MEGKEGPKVAHEVGATTLLGGCLLEVVPAAAAPAPPSALSPLRAPSPAVLVASPRGPGSLPISPKFPLAFLRYYFLNCTHLGVKFF